MLRWPTKTILFFSGLLPLLIGFFLVRLGLHFLLTAVLEARFALDTLPLFQLGTLCSLSADSTLWSLLCIAFFLGIFKGRFVLIKSTERNIERLLAMHAPIPITKMYTLKYYFMICLMMLLGMGMNWLGVPDDIRGVIDVAVGIGVFQGGLVAMRSALRSSQSTSKETAN